LIKPRTQVIEVLLKIVWVKDVFRDWNLEINPEMATSIEQQVATIKKLD
jgi:hypothetical protein